MFAQFFASSLNLKARPKNILIIMLILRLKRQDQTEVHLEQKSGLGLDLRIVTNTESLSIIIILECKIGKWCSCHTEIIVEIISRKNKQKFLFNFIKTKNNVYFQKPFKEAYTILYFTFKIIVGDLTWFKMHS
ncbi:hypothetical protein BpHYR1_032515 [Brachionus plicatilis]|uniref:Uncharacterized protein n=1 Tax=Brachionus plicatilis TaxID=10195 RepID=A0A3M7Q4A0_BRAPC|nr:hypothetical protein BpHYR1_032515 [Brachionus plicatilis]